ATARRQRTCRCPAPERASHSRATLHLRSDARQNRDVACRRLREGAGASRRLRAAAKNGLAAQGKGNAVRIGLYNEPHRGGIGGCEYSVAVLAEALRPSHEVEIIHHRPLLDAQALEAFSETNLKDVSLRYVDTDPFRFGTARTPWKRLREAESWHSDLSE